MKFKNLALALIGVATLFGASFAAAEVRDTRDVETFDSIKLRGSMDANVRIGDEQSVTVLGNEEDVARIVTEVRDGELTVRQKRGRWNSHRGIIVEVTVPSLNGFAISGSGDAEISGINSDTMRLGISGSGDIEADGNCNVLDVRISGSGDIDAESLVCQEVSVGISGSGDAAVHATETASVRVSGSGDVDLYGNPRIEELRVSGSGAINAHASD